jgi:parallel beta-helix repeat protein
VRRRLSAIAPIGLAAALLCFTARPALGGVCGTTITQSIVLQADETCASGTTGITVGADGLTIDLGGHTLRGSGISSPAGIAVGPFRGITIKNGTVTEFDNGITTAPQGAPHLKLSGVTTSANAESGALLGTTDFSIDRCAFLNNTAWGLRLAAQSGKVSNSIAAGNSVIGLLILSGNLTITKVTSANNGRGIDTVFPAVARIQRSRFLRNADWGVLLESASTLSGSTVVGNGVDGVRATSSGSTITGNLIAGNVGNGINVSAASNTTVTKNRLVGNHADGVHVDAGSVDTLVERNTAVGNGGEGLSIASASTTLMKNVTNANTDSGVSAGSVIDGGGNTARANGAGGCSGAVCPAVFVGKPGTTTPVCGMSVTASIKLGADSPICTGSAGLVVVADHVTIDLNGHTLHGDQSANHAGIDVGGHARVTIQNGVVENFDTGISSTGAGLKLVNVELRANTHDGADLGGDGIAVRKSTFVLNGGTGMHVSGGVTPKVSASFFVANGAEGLDDDGEGGTLASLTAAGNTGDGVLLGDPGVAHLTASTLADNGGAGLAMPGASSATSTIAKNVVVGNQMQGIAGPGPGTKMVFDSNLIGGNLLDGMKIGPSSATLVITKNGLFGNAKNGLIVVSPIDSALVKSNAAAGNAQTGIEIDVAGVTLAKNIGEGNEIGIAPSPGDTDGGGNVARGNTEFQCLGNVLQCE